MVRCGWVIRTVEKSTQPVQKNAFVQRNIYTLNRFEHIDPNSPYDDFIESIGQDFMIERNVFSNDLEEKASHIVQQIIKTARRSNSPLLTSDQAHDFKRFLFPISRRTPESRERAKSMGDEEDFLLAVRAHADEVGHKLPPGDQLLSRS